MNLLDCPIKDLPSKGGRFSNIRRNYKNYSIADGNTIRLLLDDVTEKGIYNLPPLVGSELLQFLLHEKLTKF